MASNWFTDKGTPFDRLDGAHLERYDAHGRQMVDCDEECPAFAEPNRSDVKELQDALDHWEYHSFLGGCSHAC